MQMLPTQTTLWQPEELEEDKVEVEADLAPRGEAEQPRPHSEQ